MGTSQKARVFKQLRSVGWSSKILMDRGGYSARLFPVGILRSAEIPDDLLRWDIPAWSMETGNPRLFHTTGFSNLGCPKWGHPEICSKVYLWQNIQKKNTTFGILYEGLHPILIVFLLDFFRIGLRFWDAHSCSTLKKHKSSLALGDSKESYWSIILKPQGFTFKHSPIHQYKSAEMTLQSGLIR